MPIGTSPGPANDRGDILKHELMINADRFLPVDATLIPLGRLDPVKGTAMDFTAAKAIGRDMAKVEGGYDHCYVLSRKGDGLSLAARVTEPTSGRVMEVYTTQPAVQFYTGNFLDGTIHAGGKTYGIHYRLLPGDAALSRFAEPKGLSHDGAQAGRDLQADDGPQVQRAEVRTQDRKRYHRACPQWHEIKAQRLGAQRLNATGRVPACGYPAGGI